MPDHHLPPLDKLPNQAMSASLSTKVLGHSTTLEAETLIQNCSRRMGSWGRREQKADGPFFSSSAHSLMTCDPGDSSPPLDSRSQSWQVLASSDLLSPPTTHSLECCQVIFFCLFCFSSSERRPAGAPAVYDENAAVDLLQSRSEGLTHSKIQKSSWKLNSKK